MTQVFLKPNAQSSSIFCQIYFKSNCFPPLSCDQSDPSHQGHLSDSFPPNLRSIPVYSTRVYSQPCSQNGPAKTRVESCRFSPSSQSKHPSLPMAFKALHLLTQPLSYRTSLHPLLASLTGILPAVPQTRSGLLKPSVPSSWDILSPGSRSFLNLRLFCCLLRHLPNETFSTNMFY